VIVAAVILGVVVGIPLIIFAASCVNSVLFAYAERFDRWARKRIGAA
jgi:hypothetical protein